MGGGIKISFFCHNQNAKGKHAYMFLKSSINSLRVVDGYLK